MVNGYRFPTWSFIVHFDALYALALIASRTWESKYGQENPRFTINLALITIAINIVGAGKPHGFTNCAI